jgi:hypothetical protein
VTWRVADLPYGKDDDKRLILDSGGQHVATVHARPGGNLDADALVAAAARDLLRALWQLLQATPREGRGVGGEWYGEWTRAFAAIEKAIGGKFESHREPPR